MKLSKKFTQAEPVEVEQEQKNESTAQVSDVEPVTDLSIHERIGLLTIQKRDWYYMACDIYDDDQCFEIINHYSGKKGGVKFDEEFANFEALNSTGGTDRRLLVALTKGTQLNMSYYSHDITMLDKSIRSALGMPAVKKNTSTLAFETFEKLFLFKVTYQETASGKKIELYTPTVALLVLQPED